MSGSMAGIKRTSRQSTAASMGWREMKEQATKDQGSPNETTTYWTALSCKEDGITNLSIMRSEENHAFTFFIDANPGDQKLEGDKKVNEAISHAWQEAACTVHQEGQTQDETAAAITGNKAVMCALIAKFQTAIHAVMEGTRGFDVQSRIQSALKKDRGIRSIQMKRTGTLFCITVPDENSARRVFAIIQAETSPISQNLASAVARISEECGMHAEQGFRVSAERTQVARVSEEIFEGWGEAPRPSSLSRPVQTAQPFLRRHRDRRISTAAKTTQSDLGSGRECIAGV